MLHEDIEYIETFSVVSGRDDMVTNKVSTRQFEIINFGSQLICLTGVICAHVHRAISTADGDLHIGKVSGYDGYLRVIHRAVAVEELGRKCVSPLR